mmetsp:Transcript_119737/g.168539  ORF Transcript_119737/g.168539 Transcript_119737/m.168539 type:complete len:233 (-) Transcript_119737:108-806(-)
MDNPNHFVVLVRHLIVHRSAVGEHLSGIEADARVRLANDCLSKNTEAGATLQSELYAHTLPVVWIRPLCDNCMIGLVWRRLHLSAAIEATTVPEVKEGMLGLCLEQGPLKGELEADLVLVGQGDQATRSTSCEHLKDLDPLGPAGVSFGGRGERILWAHCDCVKLLENEMADVVRRSGGLSVSSLPGIRVPEPKQYVSENLPLLWKTCPFCGWIVSRIDGRHQLTPLSNANT